MIMKIKCVMSIVGFEILEFLFVKVYVGSLRI